MASQTVGIQEFQENLASFLEGKQTLVITRQGETLGFFVPSHRSADRKAALERVQATSVEADALVQSWGASEEELMAEIESIRRAEREKSRNGG
jgi:hypothetical protein